MKTLIALCCAVSLWVAPNNPLFAQFAIGANNGSNGSEAYPAPIFDYYKTMRAQYLYLASEMTSAGMTAGFIDEISWNVTNIPTGTGTTEDYTLKMLATELSTLSLTGWEEVASVVWGPGDYNPVLGANTFVLASPFYWDGITNIIVEVCGGDDNVTYTKNARVTWTGPLGFNASRTYVDDIDTDPCAYSGGAAEDPALGGADYRPRATFGLSEAINCNLLPFIGTTNTTSSSVCAGEEFSLSIGAIAELGISYSWASSPDGVVWTTILGANTSSYLTSQTESTYYQCTVTCDLSGDNAASTPVFIAMNPETECYCVPSYILGTIYGDFISNVNLEAINNSTGLSISPFYTYYEDLITDIVTGNDYTLSLSVGAYETDNCIAAWIDFNSNGDFEIDEKIGESIGLPSFATVTYYFTPPADALPGVARMRVRDVYNQSGIDPCFGYEYGETEDYNVNIIEGNPPIALFTYLGNPNVAFDESSTGEIDSWEWDFGDGSNSTTADVEHTYLTNGVYNVCLTVTGFLGANTNCQNVTIDYYILPVAEFTYINDPIVSFTDLTANSPTSWNWSFGDGFSSTLQNPVHNYSLDGVFAVCLTATNVLGSNSSCQFVEISGNPEVPVADFTFSGDPDIAFTDISTNVPTSWFWNFGDGVTSVLQNPTHTYTFNGTNEVCLTATNAAGESTVCKIVIVTSYLDPAAVFTYSGDPEVTFTDLSTNDPITWLWVFGDGATSDEQNPVHNFETNSIYNVCLSVTAPGGSDTYCTGIVIIGNAAAPVADFSYVIDGMQVDFTDLSSYEPTEWFWDFDDGEISGLQNPSHTFENVGVYSVCLKSTNVVGFNETCKSINLLSGIDNLQVSSLTLYPNPASTNLTVEYEPSLINSTIEVYNSFGEKVEIEYFYISSNMLSLNLSPIPAGSYIIFIHNLSYFGTQIFVKQ
jgi:PKD repeat protein